MNIVWIGLILLAVLTAALKGTMPEVSKAAFDYAKIAVELSLGLIGSMALFLGLMKIAQDAGLVQALAKLLRPLFKFLFPKVPKDHPALGAIALNMGANMLGLGDAATPMGLKAMQELQELNPTKDTATDAMCTFLALNSSSVQLVPAVVIGLRVAAGSKNPAEIILAAILATTCSTIVAIFAAKFFSRLPFFKNSDPQGGSQ